MLRSQLSGRLLGCHQLSEIQVNAQVWNVQVWHFATFRCAAEFDRHRGTADIEQNTIQEDKPCDHRGIPEPAQKWHHVLATKLAVDFQFGRTP
jgi:hypothetical protein